MDENAVPDFIPSLSAHAIAFKALLPDITRKYLGVQVAIVSGTVRYEMTKTTVPVCSVRIRHAVLIVELGKDFSRVHSFLGTGGKGRHAKDLLIKEGIQNLVLSFNGLVLVS